MQSRAEFERDPITKLTQRLLVAFQNPVPQLAIIPIHDEDGYMVAADFSMEPT